MRPLGPAPRPVASGKPRNRMPSVRPFERALFADDLQTAIVVAADVIHMYGTEGPGFEMHQDLSCVFRVDFKVAEPAGECTNFLNVAHQPAQIIELVNAIE